MYKRQNLESGKFLSVRTATCCLWLVFFSFGACAEEADSNITYRLGSGDQLEIKVVGEDDVSGQYTIDGSGKISMAFIGTVKAKGSTINELEEILINKLKPDYLLNPRVNIQVLNYRPFYILGEVQSPASYPYVDGMTYLNSVIIAGGFTYRAKKHYVLVIRANDREQKEIEMKMDSLVMPGDIIKVEERMF